MITDYKIGRYSTAMHNPTSFTAAENLSKLFKFKSSPIGFEKTWKIMVKYQPKLE